MIVDLSTPSGTFIVLDGAAVDIHNKNTNKYSEFWETLGNSISKAGGQKTGDEITTNARKFKRVTSSVALELLFQLIIFD